MFSPLRNRFGIPGVISVIALVFAMFGGAYAANNSGAGKATASAKAKQGPRGKTGKTGPAGPAGPAGPQGSAGAKGDTGAQGSKGDKGDNGEKGTNGTNGTNGADGESPEELATLAPGEEGCVSGGVLYGTANGDQFPICNGKEGKDGKEGSPWTAGGTLPSGETETGAWAATGDESDTNGVYAAVSFPIPLEESLDESHVVWAIGLPKPEGCNVPGTGPSNPGAKPGYLCVYPGSIGAFALFDHIGDPSANQELGGTAGAGLSGALIAFKAPSEPVALTGTFAVTAPLATP
jgi:hypothetical protein